MVGATLVAAALHAGVLALGVVAPAGNPFLAAFTTRGADGPLELLEIDVTRAPGAESVAWERPALEPVAPERPASQSPGPASPAVAPPEFAGAAVAPPEVAGAAVEPPDAVVAPRESDWSLSPDAAGGAPGPMARAPLLSGFGPGGWALPGVLGALPDDLGAGTPSAPAPTEAPARPAVEPNVAGRVLSQTLADRDKGLGLDQPAAGVVASAVADAVRGAAIPDETKATFHVDIAPGGKVVGTRVVTSTKGTSQAWEAAASRTAAALAAKSLTLRGDADKLGATIVVHVEARDLYPAGTKKQVDVQPVCAEEVITDLIEEQMRAGDDPGSAAAPKKKGGGGRDFCIPIAVAGIGDVSNAGAGMQRVVRTSHEVRVGGRKALPHEIHPVNKDAPWLDFRGKEGPKPVLPPEWRRKKKEWEKKRKGR